VVFLESPRRKALKNVIKKIEKKIGFGFFGRFICNCFGQCFELPSLRNTPKRDKTKKNREKKWH
jgi:hypothetical protein